MKKNDYLLPTGFYDLFGDKVEIYNFITSNFLSYAKRFGYNQIIPSLIEFEENISGNKSTNINKKHLVTIDPSSGRSIAVRNDITTQIGHIIKKRLHSKTDNKNSINRICYAGESFAIDNSLNLKQFTQIGIELIGENSVNADMEAVNLAIRFLQEELCFKDDLLISFSIPKLTNIILDLATSGNKAEYDRLFKAIKEKNISELSKMAGNRYINLIQSIILPSYDIVRQIGLLTNLSISKEIDDLVSKLAKILTEIINQNEDKEIEIMLDLMLPDYSNYHTDMLFSIYSKQSNVLLCRGGRYIIDDMNSVGFSVYASDILDIMIKNHDKVKGQKSLKILIPNDLSFDKICNLQKDGYITIYAISDDIDLKKQAIDLNCQFIYKDNLIKEVEMV